MASRLFQKAPKGSTLEDVGFAVRAIVEKLEERRVKAAQEAHARGEPPTTYAKVHVGHVLVHPWDKVETLLISYSDHDKDMPKLLTEAFPV